MTKYRQIIIITFVLLLAAAGGYWFRLAIAPPLPAGSAGEEFYTCPMHPFVAKDKPGSCPVCGMELVRKSASQKAPLRDQQRLAELSLSPAQQIIANLATTAATVMPLAVEINAAGTVAFNQTRQSKIAAWSPGQLDRLHVAAVGGEVRQGMVVAELFSADLAYAEEEYLLAYEGVRQFASSPPTTYVQNAEALLFAARQRLRLLGFKEPQFRELEVSRQPKVRVPIVAGSSGLVIDKLVQQGQYVNVGETLFTLADLAQVWVELEVYEHELPLLKTGQQAAVRVDAYPGEIFAGRISYLYPFLDPKSRTAKVRVEVPNRGMKLKPEMLVSATVRVDLPPSISVPVTALLDTGKRQLVWVEKSAGVFIPRDVKVGARAGANMQILSGLQNGEKVAVSGGYLLDSESQLRGMQHNMPAKAATPLPADELDMKGMKMPAQGEKQRPAPAPAKKESHQGMPMGEQKQ